MAARLAGTKNRPAENRRQPNSVSSPPQRRKSGEKPPASRKASRGMRAVPGEQGAEGLVAVAQLGGAPVEGAPPVLGGEGLVGRVVALHQAADVDGARRRSARAGSRWSPRAGATPPPPGCRPGGARPCARPPAPGRGGSRRPRTARCRPRCGRRPGCGPARRRSRRAPGAPGRGAGGRRPRQRPGRGPPPSRRRPPPPRSGGPGSRAAPPGRPGCGAAVAPGCRRG